MANARATLMSALTVANGDVERSQAEVDAAKIALDRATKLLADKAGSARAVDDAQAQLNVAESLIHAAQQRVAAVRGTAGRSEREWFARRGHAAVDDRAAIGSYTQPAVMRGQTVTAGAALFEVVDTNSMWIRVPDLRRPAPGNSHRRAVRGSLAWTAVPVSSRGKHVPLPLHRRPIR